MSGSKRAVLYSNTKSDIGCKTARQVESLLLQHDRKTQLYTYPSIPELSDADVLVTFGGDGTILYAARAAAETGVPILGVNMGGKGFIAELEPDDISTELIGKIAEGMYKTEQRMMLDVEVTRGNDVVCENFALNDIVIKGDNKVIELSVFADGQMITRYEGDGTIVATPTGSTAYSMSAGGPIVEPCAENIIITPICAHMLEAKSFVLTPDKVITVKTGDRKDHAAYISVDGGEHFDIKPGEAITIRKSRKLTHLVKLSEKNFYNKLSAKLISAR